MNGHRRYPGPMASRRPFVALGQWEDVGAWEDYADTPAPPAEVYEPPAEVYEPVYWEPERPPPQDEPEVYEIERPPPQDEPAYGDVHEIVRPGVTEAMSQVERAAEYTTAQLQEAAAAIVDMGRTPDGGPNFIEKLASTFFTGLGNAAPAVLKGLFPAGLPPVWTPCGKIPGTYWTGKSCAPTPSSCPTGTYWTGTACERISGFRWPWEGGAAGEGEGGAEGEGGLFLSPTLTQQPWFWPVAIIGGGVIVALLVRRR